MSGDTRTAINDKGDEAVIATTGSWLDRRKRPLLGERDIAPIPGRVAHDPVPEQPAWCQECDEAWSCAERKRQRQTIKEIAAYLKSDLYDRDQDRDEDPEGMRWTSPLGWSVWLSYGLDGVLLVVRNLNEPERVWACTDHATVGWLDEGNLP